MTKDELLAMFDKAIVLFQAWIKASEGNHWFTSNHKPPVQPTVVENLDEWIAYLHLKAEYETAAKIYDDTAKTAKKEWEDFEKSLMKLLPVKVWFKHGDFAIGVAYTDWGGSNYYIDIVPWSKDLPSLDRTYRGN